MVGYGGLGRVSNNGVSDFTVSLKLSKRQKRLKKLQYQKVVVDPSHWGESEALSYEQQLAENRAHDERFAMGNINATYTTTTNSDRNLEDNRPPDLKEEEVEPNKGLLGKDTSTCVDLPIDLGIRTVCWLNDDNNEEFMDYPLMCLEQSTNNDRDTMSLWKSNDWDVNYEKYESGMSYLSNSHAGVCNNFTESYSLPTVMTKGEKSACNDDDVEYLMEASATATTIVESQMMMKEDIGEQSMEALRLPPSHLISNGRCPDYGRGEMSADSNVDEGQHPLEVLKNAGEGEALEVVVAAVPQHKFVSIAESNSIYSDCHATLNNCIGQVDEGNCVADIDQYDQFSCAGTVMCVDDGTEV